MRRKGERHIPDFSPKHKQRPDVEPERKLTKASHPVRGPAVKPQATSSKSGRRGQ